MELTTYMFQNLFHLLLFMMSKIQNLNGTHNTAYGYTTLEVLFMMSKIQNLNGTHNVHVELCIVYRVVYDVKDTKFEWNSQHTCICCGSRHSCL